jgi:hypothetical protein
MTQEERVRILNMASDIGLSCIYDASRDSYSGWRGKVLEFASLVAAKEREAYAKVCDNKQYVHPYHDLGTLIRARGEA